MIETEEDLDSFFDTGDFADEGVITGPAAFSKTLNGILNTGSEQVALFGSTNLEEPDPSFVCKESDLVGVKTKMTLTVRGTAYKIERIARDEAGVATVYLSK